ncbi:MAG: hypothetical protein D6756_10210 [Cyanobacteria bacterium J083]|nr:MAG: hypothetical protein D6756_10210 [Cyanobacteria bacterium J083]
MQIKLTEKLISRSLLILFCLFCFKLTFLPSVNAQSLSSLHSDIVELKNRVNRLESQIIRLNSSNRPLNPSQVKPDPLSPRKPVIIEGEAIGKSDPMFARLATLVIELKEDIKTLTTRVNNLEKKINN